MIDLQRVGASKMPPPQYWAPCRVFSRELWPELAISTLDALPLDLETITACLPLAVLVFSIPMKLLANKKKVTSFSERKKRGSWGVVNNIRLLLALLVLAINVIFRLLLALDSSFCPHDIILLGVSFFTLVLGIGDLLAVLLQHQVTSVTQIVFWMSISLCNIPHILDSIHPQTKFDSPVFFLPVVIQIITFIVLVLQLVSLQIQAS